jgi:hypothetical protein
MGCTPPARCSCFPPRVPVDGFSPRRHIVRNSGREMLWIGVLVTAIIATLMLASTPARSIASESRATVSDAEIAEVGHGQGPSASLIENRGQLDQAILYYATGAHAAVYFTSDAVIVDLRDEVSATNGSNLLDGRPASVWEGEERPRAHRRGHVLRVGFVNANPNAVIEPRGQLGMRYNYFLGDPSRWAAEVPAYSAIVYKNLWPGIDVEYRLVEGLIAYELHAAAGTALEDVEFTYEGADRVTMGDDGVCRLETGSGTLVDARPSASRPAGTISRIAHTPVRDREPTLTDDPSRLIWSTFLGASEQDRCNCLALDASDNPVVAGYTESPGFPTTPGAYDDSTNGGVDAFISKLDASGSSLLWSTYLGGSGTDVIDAVAVDPTGNVVVVGGSNSSNFPTTTGAYDESHNGARDIVVSKLDPSGSTLLWSTYLGGTDVDDGRGLSLDAQANVIVTGEVRSSDFPTTPGAYDESHNGSSDAVVARLNATTSALLWSTFLGEAGLDQPNDVAVGLAGSIVVVGQTQSVYFPTTPGAYDSTYDAPRDAFVARFDSSGTSLVWSTLLGGNDEDWINCVVMDPMDNPVVGGRTWSDDFPTTPGAYDGYMGGSSDGFAAKLASSGSSLLWSTFLKSSGGTFPADITMDSGDNVVVTGYTTCPGIATTPDAYQNNCKAAYEGCTDGFVIWLNPSGTDAIWATHVGGQESDLAMGVALDASENLVVAGYTCCYDFPTTFGAYDRIFAKIWDAFVLKFALHRAGIDSRSGLVDAIVRPNRPNPFGLATYIEYELASSQRANLSVYDVRGKLVRVLIDGHVPAGTHVACWDGCDMTGRQVSPGMYLYRLTAGGRVQTGKAVIVH